MKFLFAFHFFFFLAAVRPASAQEAWKLAGTTDGVAVSERPVAGSKIKEVQGETVMETSADRIFAVLSDVDSYPDLMPPTVIARRLKGDSESVYYYMVIDPPMIRDRDYCIHMKRMHLPGGILKTEWAVDNEVCPAITKGMIRIADNSGHWLLTPLPGGKTLVHYQAHTDPGGAVPKWIVNRVTLQMVPKILNNVRKAAGLARYAQKP